MKIVRLIFSALLVLAVASCNPVEQGTKRVTGSMQKSQKRGVAFNFATMEDAATLSPYISWSYNWGNSIGYEPIAAWMDANEIEYCPMCWSGSYSKDKIRAYVAAHPSTKYLLAFNEPNLTDQANMIPSKAAELWPDFLALAKELHLKIVAPAMNYGTLAGYSDPIKWMDEFLAQPGVSIDDIDVISLHCYMASQKALQSFVERFYKYNKPIWMTEFCAWENSIGSYLAQINYMCEVLNYFEQCDRVERYAWFIPRYKTDGTFPYMQMLSGSNPVQFTELGRVYCNFSTYDKTAWLKSPVRASMYVSTGDNYQVHLLQSTDPQDAADPNLLMLNAFSENQSVEYQIYLPSAVDHITLRYTSFATSSVVVYVDDDVDGLLTLPMTGSSSAWTSYRHDISIAKGYHRLRFETKAGAFNLSSFEY